MPQAQSLKVGSRAFADGRQFPRATAFTASARKYGVFPWQRESLTDRERRGGSIFGYGFVDKPWETSQGEVRQIGAIVRNNVRAEVRERMDRGETDAQIASWLSGLGGSVPVVGDPVAADIRRRFGL